MSRHKPVLAIAALAASLWTSSCDVFPWDCEDCNPPPCAAGCVEGACAATVDLPPGPPATDAVLWSDFWRQWCEPRAGEDVNRPELFDCLDADGVVTSREHYHYDELGRVTRIDHFSYPAELDRVTAHLEVVWANDQVATITHLHDAVGGSISWSDSFEYTDGAIASVFRDDGAITVQNDLSYDAEGRLREHVERLMDARPGQDSRTIVRHWDEDGLPADMEMFSAADELLGVESYEHDGGRIVRQVNSDGSGAALSSRVYSYDESGALVSVGDDHDGDLRVDSTTVISDNCCGGWCVP